MRSDFTDLPTVTRNRRSVRRRLASALTALFVVACSGDAGLASGILAPPKTSGGGTAAPSAAVLAIVPDSISASVGDSTKLVAVAYDASGAQVSASNIVWASADTSVVVVTSDGYARAVNDGQAFITASSGAMQARAHAWVSGSKVASISISPTSATIGAAQTVPFTATLKDASGRTITGRQVLWSSSLSPVAKVDTLGDVTGVSAGTATITATSGSVTASVSVTVVNNAPTTSTLPGAVNDLSATANSDSSVAISFTAVNDGTGQPANYELRYQGGGISWSTASPVLLGSCKSPIAGPAIGSRVQCTVLGLVPSATYAFQVVAFRGTPSVNAIYGPLSNVTTATTPAATTSTSSSTTAPGTVTNLAAAAASDSSVAITFTAVNDGTGQPASYNLRYAVGTINWGSATSVTQGSCATPIAGAAIGTVVHCTVLGLAPSTGYQFQIVAFRGTLNVSATFGALSNVASAATSAGPSSASSSSVVTSVTVSPTSIADTVGQTAQLVAVVKDQNGNVMSGQTISWTSSNTAVAAVNANGLVSAVGAGSATITASTGGKSGSAALSVAAASTTTTSTSSSSSSAEPMPTSGTTLWHDDFSSYTSSTALLAAYSHMTGENGIFLDATGGYGGSPGMRVDWQQQTNTDRSTGGCNDADHLIEHSFTSATEIYVQYYVRYQAGFQFDWRQEIANGTAGQCNGGAKKLFLVPAVSGSRLQLISENHHIVLYTENQLSLMTGQPGIQNVGSELTPEQLGDGNWHRITIHAKMSSSPSANDGFLYGWIDGQLKWSNPAYATGNTGGWYVFQVPTVFNNGSPVAQSEWMDNLTVWRP
jgi:uncharacterized protein YjdB